MRRVALFPLLVLLTTGSVMAQPGGTSPSMKPVGPSVSSNSSGSLPTFRTCTGPTPKNDQEAAKGLFVAGKNAYEQGDHASAVRYWSDAFDRDCNAILLLRNLANAYEKASNPEAAVACLEVFLKRRPEADDASLVGRRIEGLKTQIVNQPPPAPVAPDPVPAIAPPPPVVKVAPAPPEPSSRGAGALPWIVVGTGGAVVIAGAVLFTTASSKISDADKQCPNKQCPTAAIQEQGNQGRSQRTVSQILLGAGVAGVAGGLLWALFDAESASNAPSKSKSVWLRPNVGIGYGGVLAGGRF